MKKFMLLFFIYASIVQYNDPDPAIWIAAYGFTAFITLLLILKIKIPGGFLGCLPFLAIGLLIFKLNQVESGQMSQSAWETFSETGGLLIVASWFSYLWYSTKKTVGYAALEQ